MKKQVKKRNKTLKLRVKKALARNVKQFMPSVEQCQSWFRTLNRGMFGNNLQEPELIVRRMIYDWGLCVVDWDNRKCRKGTFNQSVIPYHLGDNLSYRIELHNKFPRWKDFIETLAHEMVHLYQMQVWKDPYSNHNEYFYSWRNYFRQHNLRLYR